MSDVVEVVVVEVEVGGFVVPMFFRTEVAVWAVRRVGGA